MSYAKSLLVVCAVSSLALAADANAQSRRSGSGSRGSSGGSVTRSAPARPAPGRTAPSAAGRMPYRPYGYGYRAPYYRPGVSLGFYWGYPFYYPYWGYYGYGYPYGYYGAYGYPSPYNYDYSYSYPGYVAAQPYGGIRIDGAPRDAQVYADGYYAGIVDDFDGALQHLNLEPGPHDIEIRMAGRPPLVYDVNVPPGQTVTIHVR